MLQKYTAPRWLAVHLIIIVIAGIFIRLGIWQLDRLAERRTSNDAIADRTDIAPVDLSELLGNVAVSGREFRRVVVAGTFDVDGEVLIRSRTHNGEAGFHVVTPLVLNDGSAVLVNRGWVPLHLDTPPVSSALPPRGPVEVIGTVRESQSAPALGPRDPAEGQLQRLYWIDIPRLQKQTSYPLTAISVELVTQVPPQSSTFPIPVPARILTEGSHLAYALQWFAFAVIGLSGYGALLYRNRRLGRGADRSRSV